jgi:hypothetical protein
MANLKILIIAYFHGQDSWTVSGLRTQSWAEYFAQQGIAVDVCTRTWQHNSANYSVNALEADTQNTTLQSTPAPTGTHYFLPYKNQNNINSNKLYYLFTALKGNFNNEANICQQWLQPIQQIVNKNNYNAIITSCHPYSSLKLLSKLQTTALKITDCRDYINNNLLNPTYKFKLPTKLLFAMHEVWLKHYFKKIHFGVGASPSITKKINLLAPQLAATTILNGFEQNLFKNITPQPTPTFNISIVGLLYTSQNLALMVQGFNQFLAQVQNPSTIQINFYGLATNPAAANFVTENAGAFTANYTITNKIPRQQVLQHMANSQVLFYIGWLGWQGIYSGKIFEYLAAQRNILIAPSDADVLENLITETQAGKLANTPQQMCAHLQTWYQQWQTQGYCNYQGNTQKINAYTREAQAKLLHQALLQQLQQFGQPT